MNSLMAVGQFVDKGFAMAGPSFNIKRLRDMDPAILLASYVVVNIATSQHQTIFSSDILIKHAGLAVEGLEKVRFYRAAEAVRDVLFDAFDGGSVPTKKADRLRPFDRDHEYEALLKATLKDFDGPPQEAYKRISTDGGPVHKRFEMISSLLIPLREEANAALDNIARKHIRVN